MGYDYTPLPSSIPSLVPALSVFLFISVLYYPSPSFSIFSFFFLWFYYSHANFYHSVIELLHLPAELQRSHEGVRANILGPDNLILMAFTNSWGRIFNLSLLDEMPFKLAIYGAFDHVHTFVRLTVSLKVRFIRRRPRNTKSKLKGKVWNAVYQPLKSLESMTQRVTTASVT